MTTTEQITQRATHLAYKYGMDLYDIQLEIKDEIAHLKDCKANLEENGCDPNELIDLGYSINKLEELEKQFN